MHKKQLYKKLFCLIGFAACLASCGIYKFRDVSIDPRVKTVKIGFFQNKASYVNPQLAPQLTDKLQQKITNLTKLSRTNSDDAHYQIDGTITGYNVSTTAVTANQAASNRLNVTVHLILKNTLDNKTEEYDISRGFDFPANLSLQQAEAQLLDDMLRNLTDEIFNRIFSNW